MATANSTTPKVRLSFHRGSDNFCKTVNGKRYYLGKDHDDALETWFKFRADFEVGIDPRKQKRTTSSTMTVREGCNKFLAAKDGEVRPKTFDNLKEACQKLCNFFGGEHLIATLTPDHFDRLKKHLDTGNPLSLGNRVQRSKQVFKWLADRKYIESVDFGVDFRKPSTKEMRRHRLNQAERTLSPIEIIAATNELGIQYRACALLGINCGFGPTDCVELPCKVVDLDNGMIDWHRPKTVTLRKCPLWSETVEALQLVDRFADSKRKLFFYLKPVWISRRFTAALTAVKAARAGVSFYSLRHSFATEARAVNDDTAVRIIMGHVDDSILDEHYTHRFPIKRLEAVTDHVHTWLFGAGRKPR